MIAQPFFRASMSSESGKVPTGTRSPPSPMELYASPLELAKRSVNPFVGERLIG
jgi:hypothetical protein